MPTSLVQYEMLPTTWFFVSSLIILAVFFKFNRLLSIRNLDLIGLILFTPGLLLVAMNEGQRGYSWIFLVGFLMGIRLLFDTVMVRRPLLEPNLTPGGLTFSCFVIFAFLTASVTINRDDQVETARTVRLEQILTVRALKQSEREGASRHLAAIEPGFPPFLNLASKINLVQLPAPLVQREILRSSEEKTDSVTMNTSADDPMNKTSSESLVSPPLPMKSSLARNELFEPSPSSADSLSVSADTSDNTVVPERHRSALTSDYFLLGILLSIPVLGHLLVVLGLIYIGHCHFGNIRTGIACATLYLLLPYTNQMCGRIDHVFPAALIVWAIAMYRRPFFSGVWIGLAAGLVFYPLFLLPLWLSYYWNRGWIRFLIGSSSAFLLLIALLFAFPEGRADFWGQLTQMIGESAFRMIYPDGFWEHVHPFYRIPVMAAFFVVCFGMLLWPSHKHLGTLLCCSTLIMLGIQFWQTHFGGLTMGWYLPLMILTFFRPNLEDRIASAVVVE